MSSGLCVSSLRSVRIAPRHLPGDVEPYRRERFWVSALLLLLVPLLVGPLVAWRARGIFGGGALLDSVTASLAHDAGILLVPLVSTWVLGVMPLVTLAERTSRAIAPLHFTALGFLVGVFWGQVLADHLFGGGLLLGVAFAVPALLFAVWNRCWPVRLW